MTISKQLYHGTHTKFDQFKFTKRGVWFTDSPAYAWQVGGPIIMTKTVTLQNPLDMRKLGEYVDPAILIKFYKDQKLNLEPVHDWGGDPVPVFDEPKGRIQKLQKAGYDGVILSESDSDHNKTTSYLIFDANSLTTHKGGKS